MPLYKVRNQIVGATIELPKVDISAAAVGRAMATAADYAQAQFFHEFARTVADFQSHSHVEMQFLSTGHLLTLEAQKALRDALSCLWYELNEKEAGR